MCEEEAREERSFAPKLHRSSMTTRDSASSKRIVHFCTVVMDLKTAKHGYKRNVEEEHDFEQKMERRWQHELALYVP